MTLQEILQHRRSIRHFDATKPIDSAQVKRCIALSTLAPTSSNMQLWECYHITNSDLIQQLGVACMSQQAATTAQQLVVFVVRLDLHRKHAKAVLAAERLNVMQHSPAEKQEKRTKRWELYYGKLMPFLYGRAFGILGLIRKIMVQSVGLFSPMARQVSEADMRVVGHKSCALVAQTFMLAMAETGYDTCPMEGFDSYRVKKILGLPYAAEINMIVACGIRKPEGVWGNRFRLPFDEIYHVKD